MFEDLPLLIRIHFAAAVIALPVGLVQLLAAKGTPAHRRLGQLYVGTMLVALLSALATFGRGPPQFLFFHVLALVGLWSLWNGMTGLRRWLRHSDPEQLRRHKIDMGFSWLGLFMAGVSQLAINPRFGLADIASPVVFWTSFACLNLVMWLVGSWLIFRRLAPPAAADAPRGQGASPASLNNGR